jgi:hypothetical protein
MYTARWYGPVLRLFVQADTVLPGPLFHRGELQSHPTILLGAWRIAGRAPPNGGGMPHSASLRGLPCPTHGRTAPSVASR